MTDSLFEIENQLKDQVAAHQGSTEESPGMITRSSARAQRELDRQGVLVRLPATKGTARIRLLTAEEVLAGGWLPSRLETIMGEMLVGIGGGTTKLKASDGRDAFLKLRKIAESELMLADALVPHAFISPEVVAKESDLDPDRDDQITVDDLHKNDRRALLRLIVTNQTQGEVKILESFRAQPGSDVPGQQGDQAAAAPLGVPRA